MAKLIGQRIPRLEDRRFVLGRGCFTDDVVVPGAVHARFVRSPYAHARILSIATGEASAAPGVLGVFTAADYDADGGWVMAVSPTPSDNLDASKPGFDPERDRVILVDQPVIVGLHVRHAGEIVAVVVALTDALARDAVELVRVEYEVLPVLARPAEALAPEAPQIWPHAEGNICLDARLGDEEATAAAFARAEFVVEGEFENQRLCSLHMEPRAAIGEYDRERGIHRLITGSQGVLRYQGMLAGALGVPRERVEVISYDVGGGFGTRSNLHPDEVLVVWAARRIGRPVRWTSDRSEGFLSDLHGRDIVVRGALALDARGRIIALRATATCNIGAYTLSYSSPKNFMRLAPSVYDVPVASIRAIGVLTNTLPTTSYRGAGRPEATFAIERLLDLAAYRLQLDRAEIRRRNLIPKEALPYRSVAGLPYDAGDFHGNMERALELAGWAAFEERRAESASRGRLRGIGLANFLEAPSGQARERVVIRVLPERKADVVVGTQSSGQGHETVYAQVVGDGLGIALDEIVVRMGDTRFVEAGGGTQSDRSMRLAGTLLVRACEEIVEKARRIVAGQFESSLDEVVFSEGRIRHLPTGDALDLFAAATLGELSAAADLNARIPAFPTGCAVCEVEVDPQTGETAVVDYTQVDDVGQAINPLIVDGQVHGGIAQGVGGALFEDLGIDDEGALRAGTLMEYAVPRARDLPPLRIELREDPTSSNPLRVKGAGESGTTPAPAAAIGAVVDALRAGGIEHVAMPATAPRIWETLW